MEICMSPVNCLCCCIFRNTIEQIINEVTTLDRRIQKIKRQVQLPNTSQDIRQQMTDFLKFAEKTVNTLQSSIKDIDNMRLDLAEFFCEDPGTFKLDECFKIFQNFCYKFKEAIKENKRRQLLQEQVLQRRKQRDEQLTKKSLKHSN